MIAGSVGKSVNGILVTEELKEMIGQGQIGVNPLPRNHHIGLELKLLDDVFQLLSKRKWALVQAPEDVEFVTTDNAVSLISKIPGYRDRSRVSLGFGCANTQVHFALTKEFALVGDFEEKFDEVVTATKEDVVVINSGILSHAKRQIYTANENFYFLGRAGEMLYGIENFWENSVVECI